VPCRSAATIGIAHDLRTIPHVGVYWKERRNTRRLVQRLEMVVLRLGILRTTRRLALLMGLNGCRADCCGVGWATRLKGA